MRILLTFIAVTFALFGGVTATAQTPDGETPAVETICDPLRGLTPGLYGLCVAYCEAHDAELISPGGNPAELNVPNRKILRNYNRKKTNSDPPMPCVQQESCPCWTANQLLTMLPPSMNFDANFTHACFNDPSLAILENFENGQSVAPRIQIGTFLDVFSGFVCFAFNDGYPGGPPGGPTLPVTDEELESCNTLMAAHANANKVDGIVWDCFAPD